MALETFEAGYAGARPARIGSQWSGMWKLAQITDRQIDGAWPSPWSVSGGNQTKFFCFSSGDSAPVAIQFNDDGSKFYVVGAKEIIFQYTCATAWDLNTASYSNKCFFVGTQEDAATGLFFKSDGTKFYIVGTVNNTVYQYSCSTAWDISTASYDSVSFSVNSQEDTTSELFFKSDGTKFYIVGRTNDTIYQYSCSTAWDVSTASYDSVSFSVATEEANPQGLFFKSDGTKFYIVGYTNDTVYQYSCSTAWDVSTASYDSVSFNIATQETAPQGLFFKSDGTKFYIIGSISDAVHQYSCSTAWDVSTASYGDKTFYVGGPDRPSSPQDVQFKSDGTKFYIIDLVSGTIYQYSCSTAWDISTASYDSKSFSVDTQETTPLGLFFKSDGTKFYILGYTNDTIYQYSCSTAWDVSTASYDSVSFSVATEETTPHGLFFKSDGTKFYIIGYTNDTVFQYSCSTAWDISTASYDSVSFSFTTQESFPTGLFFKSDGTKFYIIGNQNDTVYQYSCSTAWDVSTASYDSISFSVATQEISPTGLFFKSDGTKFYIVGTIKDTIYQYSCSTAWDMSTASYDSVSFAATAGEESSARALFFKTDGTEFYIAGAQNVTAYQYSCSTAWDVSTAAYSGKAFNFRGQISTLVSAIFFKADGTKFYAADGSTSIYQYSCSTPWDVSTASYDSKLFSIFRQDTSVQALFFKDDGTKFYVATITKDAIFEYSCSIAWDISTAYYETKFFTTTAQEGNLNGLYFKSDGTKFYIVGQDNDTVYQYSCSTAWDVSTASYDGVFYTIASQEGSPTEVQFKTDGTSFYILGDDADGIFEYSVLLQ